MLHRLDLGHSLGCGPPLTALVSLGASLCLCGVLPASWAHWAPALGPPVRTPPRGLILPPVACEVEHVSECQAPDTVAALEFFVG